ncbi:MAG: phosphotransferase, partial [Lentisphaerae bacterium]|nr:phosphotransferase [Lentisphaerota bacterium]
PEFLDVQISDGVVEVRCSPVREIQFMCRGASGRSVYAEGGAELTSARWEYAKAAGYLRVQIADAQGRRAWTHPVVLG